MTSTPTAGDGGTATTPAPAEFGRVLNAVDDLGFDATGRDPIDDGLRAAAGDDTLIEFPPGEYLVTESLVLRDVRRFGMRGLGDDRRAVQFVHPRGYSGRLVNVRSGRGCVFERFTAQQTDDRWTNSGLVVKNSDGIRVTDVEVAGFSPSEGPGTEEQGSIDLIVQVTEPGGVGVVQRYVSKGGGEVGVYPKAYPGFYAGLDHWGTLRLVDCHLEDCGSTGIYAGRTHGPVKVEGGLFKNSDVAQVRVSGEGSYVRDARVVIDTARSKNARGTHQTVRGIWWESGSRGKTGGRVENCTFVANSAPTPRGLLEVDGTAGGMAVRDSSFAVNADGFEAIAVRRPGDSPMGGPPDRPWAVTLRRVRVTGTAADRWAVAVVGRPESHLEAVTVTQRGTGRDGVVVEDAPACELVDCEVVTGGVPLRVSGRPGSASGCLVELRNVYLATTIPLRGLERLPVAGDGGEGSTCLALEGERGGTAVVVDVRNGRYYGTVVRADESGGA